MNKTCAICMEPYNNSETLSEDAKAGEWLAEEVWQDAGTLCPNCLEIRTKLAMMYCHDYNT